MKPIVIFGAGKIAEVLLYFFRSHSNREVVACTVDRDFIPGPNWNGLPTCSFEEVVDKYPPNTHDMFVALGYQDMNAMREDICKKARMLGYTLASYIHPDSGMPEDCEHGDNCFVMNHANIHPKVKLGDNVFVWSGALVGHHSTIGDNCWITSGACIAGGVIVGKNCFFAINASVGNSITIAADCFIGANALVVKSTNAGEVFLTENTKTFRLSSKQFLRLSKNFE